MQHTSVSDTTIHPSLRRCACRPAGSTVSVLQSERRVGCQSVRSVSHFLALVRPDALDRPMVPGTDSRITKSVEFVNGLTRRVGLLTPSATTQLFPSPARTHNMHPSFSQKIIRGAPCTRRASPKNLTQLTRPSARASC